MSEVKQMNVWCDSVDQAAIGLTQDTYDSIGDITIKSGAKHILGIIVAAANSTPTNGENGAPVLQVNSSDLGISAQKFQLSGAISDGIATNDKESPVVAEFIPFKQPFLRTPDGKILDLDNTIVNLALSGGVTTTGGWDVAAGVMYSDALPDRFFEMEMLAGCCGRVFGGAVAFARAAVKAATLTAFTDKIKVNSTAKILRGLCGYANPNAPTAGEACVGITEFSAAAIPNFAPQRWPNIVNWDASLGTPLGTQSNVNLRGGVYWPTRFVLPRKNLDITVGQLFATALTNEADGYAGAKWS